jgi:hypothetical protein
VKTENELASSEATLVPLDIGLDSFSQKTLTITKKKKEEPFS